VQELASHWRSVQRPWLRPHQRQQAHPALHRAITGHRAQGPTSWCGFRPKPRRTAATQPVPHHRRLPHHAHHQDRPRRVRHRRRTRGYFPPTKARRAPSSITGARTTATTGSG